MKRADLSSVRRVVVKVGTSLLAPPGGGVHARRFGELARAVSAQLDAGREVVLVSSGAVGLGVRRRGLEARPTSIPDKQAAAAIGQIDLCRRYERAFARCDRLVGQILLTHSGLADRERFLNARHTLQTLLDAGVVPIVNENDSVATEELRFGDNDQLAAQVVNLSGAQLLVLLTDIDGLHDRHPEERGARRIPEIEEVSDALLEQTTSRGSKLSSGGMRSKLEAARSAARFGAATVITDGRRRDALERALAGDDVGTLVRPAADQLSSRKHWIAFSLRPVGDLHLDEGAVRALRERRASLLAAGVTRVSGRFGVGDPVRCLAPDGSEVARGLSSYDAEAMERIRGVQSARIPEVLGYSNGSHVIHRDDLILV